MARSMKSPLNSNPESSRPATCFTGGLDTAKELASLLTTLGVGRRWMAPNSQKWLCVFRCPLTFQACLPSPVGSLLLVDSHIRTPVGGNYLKAARRANLHQAGPDPPSPHAICSLHSRAGSCLLGLPRPGTGPSGLPSRENWFCLPPWKGGLIRAKT